MKPTHNIVVAIEGGDDGTKWNTIGAAWPAKSGDGYGIKFDDDAKVPLGEFIQMVPRRDPDAAADAA